MTRLGLFGNTSSKVLSSVVGAVGNVGGPQGRPSGCGQAGWTAGD